MAKEIFRRHFSKLVLAINGTTADTLANDFYTIKLISFGNKEEIQNPSITDYRKATKLLDAISRQLASEEDDDEAQKILTTVCTEFKKTSGLERIAIKIIAELENGYYKRRFSHLISEYLPEKIRLSHSQPVSNAHAHDVAKKCNEQLPSIEPLPAPAPTKAFNEQLTQPPKFKASDEQVTAISNISKEKQSPSIIASNKQLTPLHKASSEQLSTLSEASYNQFPNEQLTSPPKTPIKRQKPCILHSQKHSPGPLISKRYSKAFSFPHSQHNSSTHVAKNLDKELSQLPIASCDHPHKLSIEQMAPLPKIPDKKPKSCIAHSPETTSSESIYQFRRLSLQTLGRGSSQNKRNMHSKSLSENTFLLAPSVPTHSLLHIHSSTSQTHLSRRLSLPPILSSSTCNLFPSQSSYEMTKESKISTSSLQSKSETSAVKLQSSLLKQTTASNEALSSSKSNQNIHVQCHLSSKCLSQYHDYLIDIYCSKQNPMCSRDQFIPFKLVENDLSQQKDNTRNGNRISIKKIGECKDGERARVVLIEGAPGVGKTTLAWELCHRWANGKLFNQWSMVVLIQLRDLKMNKLKDLFYHPRPGTREMIIGDLDFQNGKGLLLILDGYDELSESQKASKFLKKLIGQEILCKASIIITSRPAVFQSNFSQSIDQHIKIMEFTDRDIYKFACGDDDKLLSNFKSILSSHPFCFNLMHIPLQCAIITKSYLSHHDRLLSAKTITDFYSRFVQMLLLQHLNQPTYNSKYWRIESLSDFPRDVRIEFDKICKFAAEKLEQHEYVFVKKLPNNKLGLMQEVKEVFTRKNPSIRYSFLSLTLQEYLAAKHYSMQHSLPPQTILENENISSSCSYLTSFLVGMCSTSAAIVPQIVRAFNQDNGVKVSLLHYLYETQSPQLIQSTLISSKRYLKVLDGHTEMDWFITGYCIANSDSKWDLYLDSNSFPMLVKGLQQSGKYPGKGRIGALLLDKCSLSLLSGIGSYTQSLNELILLSCTKTTPMDTLSYYPMLESLTLQRSCVHFNISQLNNIKYLTQTNSKLTKEFTCAIVSSLQNECCKLHHLTLIDCTIPSSELQSLLKAIGNSTSLTYVKIVHDEIDLTSLLCLARALSKNKTIETFVIDKSNDIFTSKDLELLFQAVNCSFVKKLMLNVKYKTIELSRILPATNTFTLEFFDESSDSETSLN